MKTRNLNKSIRGFIRYTVSAAQKELSKTRTIRGRRVRRVASGRLRASLYGTTLREKGKTTVSFGSKVSYAKFIEYGVNGTKVNWKSPYSYNGESVNTSWVENWAKSKGVKPKSGNTINGLKYVIGKSLLENGIAPVPYMRLGFEAARKKFDDNLFNALVKDIEIELDKNLK